MSKKPERSKICQHAEVKIKEGSPTAQFKRHIDRIYQIDCAAELCVPTVVAEWENLTRNSTPSATERRNSPAALGNLALLAAD